MASLLLGALIIVLFFQLGILRRRTEQLERTLRTTKSTAVLPSTQGDETTAARAELVTYVKDQYARGARRLEIEAALVEHGWSPGDVQAAFGALTHQSNQPEAIPSVNTPTSDAFFAWFREDWLLKLGALLLLIALGWFTTYAFMNNWIGPAGRITLGMVLGMLILILGSWRIRTYVAQGGVFLVVGSTTILLTIFAARVLYEFFTPVTALFLMFLSTAFVALQSVVYARPPLGRAALVLAAVAPLLTASVDPSAVGLFTYLFVVTFGTIVIATYSSDRLLVPLSLGIMSLYSMPFWWSGAGGDERPVLLLFAMAFGALYFLVHAGGVLQGNSSARQYDLVTAAWSGLFLLLWITSVAPAEWQSLLLSAWTVVYLVGSYLLFRSTGDALIVYVYAGTGVVLLAAATATELSGPALVIAYAIETAAVVILAYMIVRSSATATTAAWLFLVPVLLTIPFLAPGEWRDGEFRDALAVVATTAGVLVITSVYFFAQARLTGDVMLRKLAGALAIIGSVVIYALLWRILHLWLSESLAVMTALVTYTIIGIGAYVSGLRQNERSLQLYGGCLIGFVTLRLLFIDVWEMEMSGRIVTFALIGVLLMATAFIGRKQSV